MLTIILNYMIIIINILKVFMLKPSFDILYESTNIVQQIKMLVQPKKLYFTNNNFILYKLSSRSDLRKFKYSRTTYVHIFVSNKLLHVLLLEIVYARDNCNSVTTVVIPLLAMTTGC